MKGSSTVILGVITIMVLDMPKIVIYEEDGYGWTSFDYSGVISVVMNTPINIGNIWSKWFTTRYHLSTRVKLT
jgi:hypothetical protein